MFSLCITLYKTWCWEDSCFPPQAGAEETALIWKLGLPQTMLEGPSKTPEETSIMSQRAFRLPLQRGLETRKEVFKLPLNPVSRAPPWAPSTRRSGGQIHVWPWTPVYHLGSYRLTTGTGSAAREFLYQGITWNRSRLHFTVKLLCSLTPGLKDNLATFSNYCFWRELKNPVRYNLPLEEW